MVLVKTAAVALSYVSIKHEVCDSLCIVILSAFSMMSSRQSVHSMELSGEDGEAERGRTSGGFGFRCGVTLYVHKLMRLYAQPYQSMPAVLLRLFGLIEKCKSTCFSS